MKRSVSTLAWLLLALCTAVTSVTTVQAKSRAGSLGQVVICTGYGIVQITIDADGNPVQAIHPCPECIQAVAAAFPAAHVVARPAGMRPVVPSSGPAAELPQRHAPMPPARGPPVFV